MNNTDKRYRIKKEDGTFSLMTYAEVCKALGFIPDVRFVEITSRGTIGLSVGKPHEVKALLSACERCGFVPSKGLRVASAL